MKGVRSQTGREFAGRTFPCRAEVLDGATSLCHAICSVEVSDTVVQGSIWSAELAASSLRVGDDLVLIVERAMQVEIRIVAVDGRYGEVRYRVTDMGRGRLNV